MIDRTLNPVGTVDYVKGELIITQLRSLQLLKVTISLRYKRSQNQTM
jgi:hypothetical protein